MTRSSEKDLASAASRPSALFPAPRPQIATLQSEVKALDKAVTALRFAESGSAIALLGGSMHVTWRGYANSSPDSEGLEPVRTAEHIRW